MSTQGDKLKAIADAIREVDGTDEPIVANDFPDRIRSISPGVKSFNGRTGDVVPADGDYTAEQVGALPLSGGRLTGDLITNKRIRWSESVQGIQVINSGENSGGIKLDCLTTDAGNLHLRISKYVPGSSSQGISLLPIEGSSSGTGSNCVVLSGVEVPVNNKDAANKEYVDSKAGGLSVASNAGAHNSLFRGKYLGSSVTAAQYAAIAAGTFGDLFIGDYWTINGINWRIAAFDYYLGTGNTALTTHHAVIVPDTGLDTQKMNDTSVTTGGYVGSKMYTNYIATARTKVNTAFPGHVLTHEFRLSNAVTNGKVTSSTTVNQDVVLMSERNVYGQTIMSSECNNGSSAPQWSTYDRTQFPLFALAPEFIQKARHFYWLRNVVNETFFAFVDISGLSLWFSAGSSSDVRPAFSIKG